MGERLYSDNPADRAKDLLNHYMKLVWESSGLRWVSDNQAELDDLIDTIVKASREDSRQEIADLKTRLDNLESLVRLNIHNHGHTNKAPEPKEPTDGSWEEYQHFKKTHGGK